jgi:hypothetical protein
MVLDILLYDLRVANSNHIDDVLSHLPLIILFIQQNLNYNQK